MKISKKQREQLYSGVTKLVTRADKVVFDYPAGKFVKLFWDDEQVEIIKQAQFMLDSQQLDEMYPTIAQTVSVKHPVYPDPVMTRFDFSLMQPSGVTMLWPRDMREYRSDANPQDVLEFDALLQGVVYHKIDIALVREVLEFVVDSCETFEQMRYIFPPTLRLLRFAEIEGLGIDTVRRSSKIPAMPYLMREKIRHVMDWFAVMELTEGFNRTESYRSGTDIRVTLGGNRTMQFVGLDTDKSYMVSVG